MVSIRGRLLLLALMIFALPAWPQNSGKKREKFWDPTSGAPPIIRRAEREYSKGNYTRALALYKEALETLPENYLHGMGEANIHFEIGTCYTKLHRYSDAVEAVRKSDSLYPYPDYLATHCAWLGMVYSRMEDYTRSELYWQKATERDPQQSTYYAGLANNSVRLGHYDKAQEAIDKGRQVAVTADAKEEFNEAQIIVHLAKGNYQEAHRLTGDARVLGAHLLDAGSGEVAVNYVFEGGPAHLAGLAAGDKIECVNGKPVKSVNEVFSALSSVPFAATAAVRINRQNASRNVFVVAGIPASLPDLAAAARRSTQP